MQSNNNLLLLNASEVGTDSTMNNKPQHQTSDEAAQTASVGDNQMMTYMKMPLTGVGIGGRRAQGGSGTGSPSAENEESDLNFLDGLFDPLSGSSDNGSVKEENIHPNRNLKSHHMTATTDSVSMPIVNGPQHLAALQQHTYGVNNCDLSQAAVAAGKPQRQASPDQHQRQHQQDNNAIRTMSDVSSLSSSNGNTSPPTHLQQQNGPTNTYESLTTAANIISNQQKKKQQQQQQQQQQNNQLQQQQQPYPQNQQQQHPSSTAQQVAYQTWIIPPTTKNASNNNITNSTSHITSSQSSNQLSQTKQQSKSRSSSSSNRGSRGRKRGRDNQSVDQHITPLPQTTASASFNKQECKNASISEDEDEASKRRRDRNMREQERSKRISNQITQLKEILATSNIPFKPDKYSTLVSVHGYIKSLQNRSALVDSEQRKLIDTMTQTNELVNKAQNGINSGGPSSDTTSTNVADNEGVQVIPSSSNHPMSEEEEELLQYVRGIDYKSVFSRVNIALCVTRIDGRIIDCNNEFIRITGLTKDVLYKAGLKNFTANEISREFVDSFGKFPLSLFNLIAREDMQMIFEAMSEMLTCRTKEEEEAAGAATMSNVGNSHDAQSPMRKISTNLLDHWAGCIKRCHSSTRQVCFIFFHEILDFLENCHFDSNFLIF